MIIGLALYWMALQKILKKIIDSRYYWEYDLNAKYVFIMNENINALLRENIPIKDIGLLHINLDVNDYWILNEISLKIINPVIVILEYNSVLGIERAITVHYNENFIMT